MQAKQGLGSAGIAPLVLTSREFEKIVEHADDSFVTIKQRAANINWRESADYRSPSSLALLRAFLLKTAACLRSTKKLARLRSSNSVTACRITARTAGAVA
jgi:hypothetical protein